MDNDNNTEALYMQINKDLADRIRIYLTDCRNAKNEVILNKKLLIEEAVHEYIINHPVHAVFHEDAK